MAAATDESEVAGAKRDATIKTAGRVATRGHSQIAILKISTLCSYKMRWYHVLRGEVHKKYVHQIIG